ncbi:hypothetical protein PanWU01x14_364510 [Parasponia andersonii]|uniref:Uncharacterized protein n=1 Tax=Parasponia andersonii TaxID=3476 RepID=A0A2P5A6B2_PARAD|nr:hypothetical protein PanWU01x14_364510 [Parasponia andersonii]
MSCPRLGPSLSQTLNGLAPLRVGSPKGLPPEYSRKQLTPPDLDRAFNAILSRCAHWASRPDRMAACKNLTPDRLES